MSHLDGHSTEEDIEVWSGRLEGSGDTGIKNLANCVLTDLDLAMTFLDLAKISRIEETIRRNHNNARKVYNTVLHLLEKLTPDPEQQQMIEAKLALLKMRLQAVGT